MRQFTTDPTKFKPVKTYDELVHEGVKAKRYRPCKICGETFNSKFKYLTCFTCRQKITEKQNYVIRGKNIEAGAILAVERRKAEIKAAQRKKS